MENFADLFQSADWKTEKHVPVLEVTDKAKKGQLITVKVTVGKEIKHPNTTEHHISWIGLYFKPTAEKFTYEIGRFEFNAHGSSAGGPNTSTIYTEPELVCGFKTEKTGTLFASSYCNIHGLWQNSAEINLG